jgi:amino acid transporter
VIDSLKPKRLFLGKKLSNKNLEGQLLPKTIALPIFSSDPLSSVAYGPQELLMILTLGGISFLAFAPWIAAMVVILLTVIVLSYRKVIAAYPSGGGDYEVAQKNLGEKSALTVASALLLDYVMTVAVSISSGTDNIISAFPELDPYRVEIAVGFVLFLLAINLRGVRESGFAFAVPTYLFLATVVILIFTGIYKLLAGLPVVAPWPTYYNFHLSTLLGSHFFF